MGDACCKAPGCCLLGGCPLSFLCTQVHMRYKVLNHVAPGSGWDHYVCCQGYTGSCCCFHPGACCEKEMPRTCMFVEACCCAGLAVSSTRFVLMDQYKLVPDECDNRLIRFNNCMQVLSCICHFAAIFDRNLRDLAQIIDLIADIVFFSMAGCMESRPDELRGRLPRVARVRGGAPGRAAGRRRVAHRGGAVPGRRTGGAGDHGPVSEGTWGLFISDDDSRRFERAPSRRAYAYASDAYGPGLGPRRRK
jgi:hypothetical protein